MKSSHNPKRDKKPSPDSDPFKDYVYSYAHPQLCNSLQQNNLPSMPDPETPLYNATLRELFWRKVR